MYRKTSGVGPVKEAVPSAYARAPLSNGPLGDVPEGLRRCERELPEP